MALEHEHAPTAAGQQVCLPARFLITASGLPGAAPAHQQHSEAKRVRGVSRGLLKVLSQESGMLLGAVCRGFSRSVDP